MNRFSIGDIVAMSRNFSSFEDIEETVSDLAKEVNPSILVRVQNSWADLMRDAFSNGLLSSRTIETQLSSCFGSGMSWCTDLRGTWRMMISLAPWSQRVSFKFLSYSIEYMKHVLTSVAKFVPGLEARTTYEMKANQSGIIGGDQEA
ncbi:hypothetical protein EAS62_35985 [Bradyrhizobium zhanjiangense]|uniref:Phasin domain-containing protein n=1 Tax=Bradyrhizobium zhanjiangense TaxID=1325107 RepID=A0ABY0DA04_9BRAD|nr:hypothetical protein EAS62_35985 [Bradyrhizobium zhanjiangense]